MKKLALGAAVWLALLGTANAADYVIDGSGAGMHTAVNFRASHIGISALWGRFNDITGQFSYDPANISAAKITVNIDPASLDTNHEARDTHLRTSDYLDVEKFPTAGFVSTAIADKGNGKFAVTGNFTLHGVTNEITFDALRTGEGESPFGDYRAGFEAEFALDAADYGIKIAPISEIRFYLAIEGIRK